MSEKVLIRIEHVRLIQVRLRALIYGIFVIGTLGTLKPAFTFLADGARHSGFSYYASVLFYGGVSLAESWKNLTLSLVQSMPVIESAVFVAIVLVFAYSLRHIASVLSNLQAYEREHAHAIHTNAFVNPQSHEV